MEQINTLFENLLNIGMGVGAAVAAFFVMWGAFLHMSAAGSPHQMERGKSAIVNALVGFSIVLLARVIAGMIQDSIGAPVALLRLRRSWYGSAEIVGRLGEFCRGCRS